MARKDDTTPEKRVAEGKKKLSSGGPARGGRGVLTLQEKRLIGTTSKTPRHPERGRGGEKLVSRREEREAFAQY